MNCKSSFKVHWISHFWNFLKFNSGCWKKNWSIQTCLTVGSEDFDIWNWLCNDKFVIFIIKNCCIK